MEPQMLSAVIITGAFVLYMLICFTTFWRQLEEMRERTEKQDRLKGRYSGYRGLSGLTAMLSTKHPRRNTNR